MSMVDRHAGPCVGLFFLVSIGGEMKRLDSKVPFADVPEIAGFRTTEEGHLQAWRRLQRLHPDLRPFRYEFFPRGRVNWIAGRAVFLLLADRYVFETGADDLIIREWGLSGYSVERTTDPHYVSPSFRRSMGLPRRHS